MFTSQSVLLSIALVVLSTTKVRSIAKDDDISNQSKRSQNVELVPEMEGFTQKEHLVHPHAKVSKRNIGLAQEFESQEEQLVQPHAKVSKRNIGLAHEFESQEEQLVPHHAKVSKRDIHELESQKQCSRIHTEDDEGSGLQVVKTTESPLYEFFVKPGANFTKLVVHLFINNDLDRHPPYKTDRNVVINPRDFRGVPKGVEWIRIQAETYKHEVNPSIFSLGRDKVALRVSFGNKTKELVSRRWWRTHSYGGIQISVQGDADFLIDCVEKSTGTEDRHESNSEAKDMSTQTDLQAGSLKDRITQDQRSKGSNHLNQKTFYIVMLTLLSVLTVLGCLGFVAFRYKYSKRLYDQPNQGQQQSALGKWVGQPPPVPELPPLLQGSSNKISHDPESSSHVYEEFDEDTLQRLRQKLNASDLSKGVEDAKGIKKSQRTTQENEYDIPKKIQLQERVGALFKSKDTSSKSDPMYANANDTSISLVEQKIKVSHRDSVPESHYVEMHGIINAISQDTEN